MQPTAQLRIHSWSKILADQTWSDGRKVLSPVPGPPAHESRPRLLSGCGDWCVGMKPAEHIYFICRRIAGGKPHEFQRASPHVFSRYARHFLGCTATYSALESTSQTFVSHRPHALFVFTSEFSIVANLGHKEGGSLKHLLIFSRVDWHTYGSVVLCEEHGVLGATYGSTHHIFSA